MLNISFLNSSVYLLMSCRDGSSNSAMAKTESKQDSILSKSFTSSQLKLPVMVSHKTPGILPGIVASQLNNCAALTEALWAGFVIKARKQN